ncbi:MAG: hypothetical protein NVSMB17_07890 [Candidatus Dormibacteria bacterium]
MYRNILRGLDVLAIMVGTIFTGQGLGLIKGSYMTGSGFWLVVGLVLLVGGAGHFALLTLKGGAPRP